MNSDLVSIIIPSYNRGHLIGETLDSVLKQTYLNWECIVIDDGSTDNTETLLEEYCKLDSRFRYHKRPPTLSKGSCVCRNLGYELSKGTFIKWLDSDDLLSSEIIATQVDALLKSGSTLNISTAKFDFFQDSIQAYRPRKEQVNKNYKQGFNLLIDLGIYDAFLPAHSYLMHKDVLSKSGLWNEKLLINQDGEFFVRVLLNVKEVIHANQGMVYYRFGVGDDNVSRVSSPQKAKDVILSWILIDTYIKIYSKENESIQYVKNAKRSLLKIIDDKDLLKEFDFFLEREKFNFELKKSLQLLKKKFFAIINKTR